MKIEIPKNCPCCDYPLVFVVDQLFCRNSACSAQLSKKLEHFTKTLGIKGAGPRTLEKLNLADITEIFYLDRDYVVKQLGSTLLADKLLNEIERAAKSSTFSTVLASFSIPLVGNTVAQKLSKVVNNFDEITEEKCKEAGLGEKVTSNIINWLNTEYLELKDFSPFTFSSNIIITQNTDETICITGKLSSFKTKTEATEELEKLGFKVVDSVTKTLKYLVDEQDKDSSKRKKAESYGVSIVTNLNQFMKDYNK